jgi:hypothetical protein
VVKLFLLHRDRAVLGAAWKGWVIKGESIVDPDGNETSQPLLRNYFWVVQIARALAAEVGQERYRAELDRLLA